MSKIIGVILLVAIAVLLAATAASTAIGFADELEEPAPAGSFDQEYRPTGEDNDDWRPVVLITHDFGEPVRADRVRIIDDSGNSIYWNEVWTGNSIVNASEYVHVDGFESDKVLDPICEAGDGYRIVLEDEDGDSLVVTEWEAPVGPRVPSDAVEQKRDYDGDGLGDPIDEDGDGIPKWCD